jgi:hypothetical protein
MNVGFGNKVASFPGIHKSDFRYSALQVLINIFFVYLEKLAKSISVSEKMPSLPAGIDTTKICKPLYQRALLF